MSTEIEPADKTTRAGSRFDLDHPRYKWVALSNTTLGTLLAAVNASIVLISLPAIFRGIDLNPLSRTSMTATVTIVDEVSRASSKLLDQVVEGGHEPGQWDNAAALNAALDIISDASVEA